MNLMLLGVMFLSWLKPSVSRGPDGGLGKGGLYGLARWDSDA